MEMIVRNVLESGQGSGLVSYIAYCILMMMKILCKVQSAAAISSG